MRKYGGSLIPCLKKREETSSNQQLFRKIPQIVKETVFQNRDPSRIIDPLLAFAKRAN